MKIQYRKNVGPNQNGAVRSSTETSRLCNSCWGERDLKIVGTVVDTTAALLTIEYCHRSQSA